MKPEEFLRWKAKIPLLTKEQKEQVVMSLKVLGMEIASTDSEFGEAEQPDDDDWLWPGLQETLLRKGWTTREQLKFLRKTATFRDYKKRSRAVCGFFDTLLKGDTRNRHALACMISRALIMWVEERKRMPQTVWSVIKYIEKAPEAFDAQLPGYVGANMFHMLLDGLDMKKRKKRHG